MFVKLIGTIFAGFLLAGIVLVLNKLTGGRLPRWATPVAAGLGMIGLTVYFEYTWFESTREKLPESFSIIKKVESRAFYRPWTYAVPFVDRFAAIDAGSVRTNEQVPEQRLVELYFFGRWAPVSKLPVVVNCKEFSRANLADGAEFADDGRLLNADWIDVTASDPIVEATCGV
ncbi:hypothetical protein [Ruegeria atlantica]|uniref:hypothetical protein n=1 Tax=Ruegeria atlantica TaxID=81569 RepID=UPI0024956884|nr:hypothetical protein [Ruegeria atlantica]